MTNRSRGKLEAPVRVVVSVPPELFAVIEAVRASEHEATVGGMTRRLIVEALRARKALLDSPRDGCL
jgi:hypothetical protein